MHRAQKSRPTLSLDPVPSADGDEPQGPSVVDAADAASETLPEVAPEQPIEALAEAPTPIIEQAEPTPFGDGEGIDSDTPAWLQVLEVVAGALAAVFLVGLFLRWHTTRRDLG